MTRLLLNKFIRTTAWMLIGFLVATQTMAAGYTSADTCQHPDPPVITGSATAVCRNEAVLLSASGCVGTVVWSNGDTGNSITVQPQQTTKYTAICRSRPGCISCFAEVWKVTVNTLAAPTVKPLAALICAGDAATLTATNCAGIVHWPDQTTGSTWTGTLRQSTVFTATCEQNKCLSNPSTGVLVQVSTPVKPLVSTESAEICTGQSARITASGCAGTVRWSDGGEGLIRSVTPYQTTNYRAICQIGSCRSDSSDNAVVTVRSLNQKPNLLTALTNGCPFQTADLSKAITDSPTADPTAYYAFRQGPSLASLAVQSPGAVVAGTYYIFARTASGCYQEPVAVTVSIGPCQQAIPPCLSNPATVAIRLDTLDWAKGVITVHSQLGGSAGRADWQSSGGGLFVEAGQQMRYLLSETDRQRGSTTFTLTSPDPDGAGPCVGAKASMDIAAPAKLPEIVGLSKKVSDPLWVTDGPARLVELVYQLTAVNLGKHPLAQVQVSDDLDAVFSVAGASVRTVTVRADSGLVVNPAYTGRGADTTLLLANSQLLPGGQAKVWLTVRVDVSQANTLTFINKANVQALDVNGGLCRDRSTNGTSADPDQNGNPADNDEPTAVTLHSLRPEEGQTVFIPEGFSPNGDGINDQFVIQQVPPGITVQLEVYNRWGHVVYQNTNYKNDWDGTANHGIKASEAKQGLPDGTYYYQIRLSDGREFVRFMTLVR